MSNITQKTNELTSIEKVECYLCNLEVVVEKSMEVPLTTGGAVRVHPSCMEFYMASSSLSGATCGSCTGDKGCC